MKRLLLVLSMLAAPPAFAELVVVVPHDTPVDTLNARQVANIFLAKTSRFPDGSRARPVELSDPEIRRMFYELIAGKSVPQLNSYWATLIFTGKGRPPRQFDDAAALAATLANEPGTVTYLPESALDPTMKVVFRVP